jgi:hypothetical protein
MFIYQVRFRFSCVSRTKYSEKVQVNIFRFLFLIADDLMLVYRKSNYAEPQMSSVLLCI